MKKIFIVTAISLTFITSPILADSKSNMMTNEAIDRFPSTKFPENGYKYLEKRTQAVDFAKNGGVDKSDSIA
ncbi:hypothetical protein [Microbulbifer epialgicus]|uniref:Uncharacterized protein n=1 Tax=Microbulbifer epialgicus TaxID=393907 RepID=A0ABV4NYV7_9GAMM